MKFLLDMPVSPILLHVLHAFGHEGVHAYQIGKDCASDSELLDLARRERRADITADLDFPRLLALGKSDGLDLFFSAAGTTLIARCAICSNVSLRQCRLRLW